MEDRDRTVHVEPMERAQGRYWGKRVGTFTDGTPAIGGHIWAAVACGKRMANPRQSGQSACAETKASA